MMSSEDMSPTGMADPQSDGVLSESEKLAISHSVVAEGDHAMLNSSDLEYGGLLAAIESMFDAKFNQLELRLNEVIDKNDAFTSSVKHLLNPHIDTSLVPNKASKSILTL